MTTEAKRAAAALRQREYRARHADDPVYRARKQAANREYRLKNKAEISERLKAAYALNPEPAKKRAAKYQQENADKVAAYRQVNRDKRNAQSKAWRESNAERVLVYQKAWYEKNLDHIKEYTKSYGEANGDLLKQKSAEWRKSNPEKLKDQGKRYRQENVIKLLDKNAKRRAVLKGATVEKVDRREVYLRDKGICGICGCPVSLEEVTLDHIIPLSKGGEHSYRNIQLAHLSCNSAKGAKIINL